MADIICDKSDRGMTYDEATQCLLELFLESWWMCAVDKVRGANGNVEIRDGFFIPGYRVKKPNIDEYEIKPLDEQNVIPTLDPEAHIHFDNRGDFFILKSDITGVDVNKVRNIMYGGKPYSFYLDGMTPATLEKKDSTGAVIQDPHEFAPHANVIIRHGQSEQTSLGGKGYRSFTRNGLLAIKLEISIDSGLTRLYECANMIAECFEGRQTNNSMWFQSVSINEEGVDGLFYNGEVIVAFEYDQVK